MHKSRLSAAKYTAIIMIVRSQCGGYATTHCAEPVLNFWQAQGEQKLH